MPAAAQGTCRLALQLALDVSGSVDTREYRLQLDGLAWALEQPEVLDALLSMPAAPVAIAVFEWSGRDYQRGLVDWLILRSAADVARVTQGLRATMRQEAPVSTAIGTALLTGHAGLADAPACARQVIDISGDGRNNDGPRPQDVQSALGPETINALVIGPEHRSAVGAMAGETEQLVDYFRYTVIRGPGAFVELAQGYDEFARTMKRKLLRELDVIVLGNAPSAMRRPHIPDAPK